MKEYVIQIKAVNLQQNYRYYAYNLLQVTKAY